MIDTRTNATFAGYDQAMADFDKTLVHPRCHFKTMEVHASDYEEWYECSQCGHTKPISTFEGER